MTNHPPTLLANFFSFPIIVYIFPILFFILSSNTFAQNVKISNFNIEHAKIESTPDLLEHQNKIPSHKPDSKQVNKNTPKKVVYIIPMHQMIDGGLTSSIKRRVELAKENNASIIIFDIDTFGGRLDSGIEIADLIFDLKDIKTIAFISNKAISAGALIAISCNEIVMTADAELGDCEPIIPSSEGGYKTAGEKVQTVLRTKFRKFAEKNGYPILLSEAMVTSEIEIYQIEKKDQPGTSFISSRELNELTNNEKNNILKKKLIVEKGKLLTMYAKEAFNYGFTKYLVENRTSLLAIYQVNENETTELVINWSEELVRFFEKLAPILMIIGMIAIFLEFKSPGFGLPGIVGILCFAAVFLSKYMVGLAETPEIILFFVGIALIAVEVFIIPGFGVTGIVGIAAMIIGLLLAFQDFTLPHTPYESQVLRQNLLTIISSFLISSFIIVLFLKFMPGIPLFNRLVLSTSETPDYGFNNNISQPYSNLIGKKGITTTQLRPAGRIEIDEKTYDVVTQGNFIEKGQTVEIINVEGNRIIVSTC